MSKPLDIIVIGAGICGLSTAIWLRRAGHGVTLIDKDHPGAGASYGNAGLLAQWAIVPMNTPDLRKTAFKYLTSPDSPLFMQWSALPSAPDASCCSEPTPSSEALGRLSRAAGSGRSAPRSSSLTCAAGGGGAADAAPFFFPCCFAPCPRRVGELGFFMPWSL